MKNTIVIIGAGGHGRVVADTAILCGYKEVIFLDDSDHLSGIASGKVIEYKKYLDSCDFFVAIGNNATRERLLRDLRTHGAEIATLIHPSAVIGSDVFISDGSFVAPGVVINTGARIGFGVIINTSSSVDHDCIIDHYCHISVGSHVAGSAVIGSSCFVGAGATVINNISICPECTIGAGAVVVKSIDKRGTYVGVPAVKINI